ncbi:oligosaccharide flippase family protein [Pseudophaeobacter sp.]|uniref:oligosaccharide flippase family protein n=1 Tax=Rhodobacterales TaxID=204455 RepID=UPI0032978A37
MKLLSGLSGTSLRDKSIRSSVLTVFDFGVQNMLRLVGNLVLTRILFPEAFGLMALVQVVMIGLNMFSDLGLRMSIIQNKRGDDPFYLDTAWVLQIGRGVLLWVLTCALAAPMAMFYDAPLLAQLLPVVGITAVLQGFNSTKMATAGRHLALGRLTVIEIGARVVGLVVLVALALWLESVWALVIGGLVAPLLIMIFSHTSLPGRRNRFVFDRSSAGELISFGKFIFLSTISGFLVAHADRAVLGKFISLSDLALYNIAFFLATLPRAVMNKLLDKVLFPLYSRVLEDVTPERMAKLAKARLLIVGCTIAMTTALAICGNWLVTLLYDPRYEAAGPILVLLALSPLSWFVGGGYAMMNLAHGHSGRFAGQLVASAAVRTTLLIVLVTQYGIFGAILAPFLAGILLYPVSVWFIWSYRGWLPLQDLCFAVISALVILAALWINQDAIRTALVQFGY